MNQLLKNIVFWTIFILLGCGIHKVKYDHNGNKILGKGIKYHFNTPLANAVFNVIDTSISYIQVYEGRVYNKNEKSVILKLQFYSDGYFSLYSNLQDTNNYRPSNNNEVGLSGKYKISGNQIDYEQFLPIKGGHTNHYRRMVFNGEVRNDTISMNDKQHLIGVFVKER